VYDLVAQAESPGVIDRLTRLRDEPGMDGIDRAESGGLIPAELETRSLRILTPEVLPAIR
jgi:hypothetical protein